jgi:hypothetical protein
MTKEEYADLLTEIAGEEVFGIEGKVIGFSSRQERADAERATFARHDSEFWALLHLGDAIHQFYRDTLDLVGKSMTPGMADVQVAMVNWHLVSFGRFAAAYHLAAHGYYFDTIALARDLWEVGLSLAALKRRIVTVDELMASGATTIRDAEKISREVDAKVRKVLIHENAALSSNARQAIDTFLAIANAATHKSKLPLRRNLLAWAKGDSLPIFPHFDSKHAAAAYNVLCQASWALISTLPYLDFAVPGTNPHWQEIFEKVQLAFREGPARGPSNALQAWPEVIRGIF